MGVDYQVWVIPKDRSFRPSADEVASLANGLRDGGWAPQPSAEGQRSEILELLPGGDPMRRKPRQAYPFTSERFTPSWIEFHSQNELVLDWSVNNQRAAGVQYPFTFDPFPDSGPPYFYVYLVLGHDFFYYTGETVMPIDERATQCQCGEQLAFWTGYAHAAPSQRIFRRCPKCHREFDPSGLSCDVLDGWTGKPSPLPGALTFRFGLVVNCHKYYPREEKPGRRFRLRPEFLDLWRTHIGVPFEQIETWD